MKPLVIAGLVLLLLGATGCGPKRPVLYPNDLYRQVGQDAAREDVNHCIEVAKTHGLPKSKPAGAAQGAAAGSVVGAAVGGAVGWVLGNPGRGAAAGAAGGGTRGAISGSSRAGDGDPLFRRFVETCLHEKGYRTIGWR